MEIVSGPVVDAVDLGLDVDLAHLDVGRVVVDVGGQRPRVVDETLLFLQPWGAGLLQSLPLVLVAGSF